MQGALLHLGLPLAWERRKGRRRHTPTEGKVESAPRPLRLSGPFCIRSWPPCLALTTNSRFRYQPSSAALTLIDRQVGLKSSRRLPFLAIIAHVFARASTSYTSIHRLFGLDGRRVLCPRSLGRAEISHGPGSHTATASLCTFCNRPQHPASRYSFANRRRHQVRSRSPSLSSQLPRRRAAAMNPEMPQGPPPIDETKSSSKSRISGLLGRMRSVMRRTSSSKEVTDVPSPMPGQESKQAEQTSASPEQAVQSVPTAYVHTSAFLSCFTN